MESSTQRTALQRTLGWVVLIGLSLGLVAFFWSQPSAALGLIIYMLVYLPFTCLFPGVWVRRGTPPLDAKLDLDRRRPVWSVLSELYLDTELDEADHARIASVLARSGYADVQLEEILYREVHPLLLTNLLSVAGEWAGFNLEWLEERILARGATRRSWSIILGKWMVRGELRAILTVVREARR